MEDVETFAAALTVPASSTVRRVVTARPEGTAAEIRRVRVVIARNAPAAVTVSTFVGESRLAPADGVIAGSGVVHELPVTDTLSPTGAVEAQIDNPTANSHRVIVTVTAVKQPTAEDS
jgi:hypothetical protein